MVTRTFEARFKSGEAVEAEPAIGRRAVYQTDDRPPAPHGRRRIRPDVAVNAGLAVMLFLDLIAETIVYGALAIEPLVLGLGFGLVAYRLHRLSEPSTKWLRISGWASVLLAGLCVLSFGTSLSAPVDIACAVASGILGVAFAGAAYYQLKVLVR